MQNMKVRQEKYQTYDFVEIKLFASFYVLFVLGNQMTEAKYLFICMN